MQDNNDPRDSGTREGILSAAARLFSERGFANVSIREICEAAKVTPPTLYYYFGNKDRLFEAVIRDSLNLDQFRISLEAALARETDPRSKLCIFAYHYLAAMPRGFFNPGMFLDNTTMVSEVSVEQVRAEFKAINDLARTTLSDGIRQGCFKSVDLEQATEFLMNLLMSYVLGEVHYGQVHEPDSASRFIVDVMLNGLSRTI